MGSTTGDGPCAANRALSIGWEIILKSLSTGIPAHPDLHLPTRKNYDTFRRNFERLMQSGILGTEAGNIMREQIRPFDERFAWTLER